MCPELKIAVLLYLSYQAVSLIRRSIERRKWKEQG